MPKISVILPVYNGALYIKDAVQSILDQTYGDFELIVLNDASTDNTLEVLQSFSDPRMKIITNEQNLRVVKSLNKGLAMATGEFIARMDGDDIAHPRRFELQVAYLEANPTVDLCGTWVQVFGARDHIAKSSEHHELIKAHLFFLNSLYHPSVMFRRSSFLRHNLAYDESFVNAEDYGLWVKIVDMLKLANVPKILLQYREHDSNVSVLKASNRKVLDEIHYRVYSDFLDKLQIPYNQNDLVTHRELAIRNIDISTDEQLEKYLHWLDTVFEANRKTKYFDAKALQVVLVGCFNDLFKRAGSSLKKQRLIYKTARKIFTPGDYLDVWKYKIQLKLTSGKV